MTKGRLIHTWDQTAVIVTTIANQYYDEKCGQPPVNVYDVHPYRKRQEEEKQDSVGFWQRVNLIRTLGSVDGQVSAIHSLLHRA